MEHTVRNQTLMKDHPGWAHRLFGIFSLISRSDYQVKVVGRYYLYQQILITGYYFEREPGYIMIYWAQ